MKAAMESAEWQAAAKRLTERLEKQKRRQS
jgi:hypothetical protein